MSFGSLALAGFAQFQFKPFRIAFFRIGFAMRLLSFASTETGYENEKCLP